MPIYEYECGQCGHRVELIQKHSDAPLEQCPQCQGAMRKLLAAPAIQFKGSGWYITDYSDKGKSKAEGAAADTTPAADGKPAKETASTDAKPSSDKPAADKKTDKKPETKNDKKSDRAGGSPAPPAANSGGGGNS